MEKLSEPMRKTLEPYAIAIAGIDASLSRLRDTELDELKAACEAASESNCWWAAYDAAQYLKQTLAAKMAVRAQKEEEFAREMFWWFGKNATIKEIIAMNREGVFTWSLSLLNALVDAGVDLQRESEATVRQEIIVTDDLVGLTFPVELNGKRIAEVNCTHLGDWYPVRKRKKQD